MNQQKKKGSTQIEVITHFAAKSFYVNLTPEQAKALWHEVKDRLVSIGLNSSVSAIKKTGLNIDTLERSDLLDAMAFVFTGLFYPYNGTPKEEKILFATRLKKTMKDRGYASSE